MKRSKKNGTNTPVTIYYPASKNNHLFAASSLTIAIAISGMAVSNLIPLSTAYISL
jgi:hypothetical protein